MDDIYTWKEKVIEIHSTSQNTADVSPIILNETDRVKSTFVPMLIDNEKDNNACVSGKFVHQRKAVNDNIFPVDKISKKNVKTGDILEFQLSSTETKILFEGLTQLYKLYSDIGFIQSGNNTYAKVDISLLQTIRKIEKLNEKISSDDIVECIDILLTMLYKQGSLGSLSSYLKNTSSIGKISTLENIVNITKLKDSKKYFESNIDNSREEDWQRYLKENQWIISQLFSFPATIYADKAYVGGKTIQNINGKIVDYLYKNDITNNVALIEIKTPKTCLLGSEYRKNIFSISDELSGGVNQLLRYKESLLKNWHEISNKETIAFNPNCLLIIGSTNELDTDDKIASFELWRSSLSEITIITFDEMKQKIDNLIKVLCDQ